MTNATVESSILPVFYYNDLLASNIGDEIGLNLFEPRYQVMCRGMMEDPRFLFMPNFENYQCRIGDVGFIIRLSSLQDRGQAWAIRGVAEEMVVVDCMWIQPRSNGLHFARFSRLPPQMKPLTRQEAQAAYASLTSHGWVQPQLTPAAERDLVPQVRLVHRELSFSLSSASAVKKEDTQLLVSQNCGHMCFLLLRSSNPEPAARLVQQTLGFLPRYTDQDIPYFHILPNAPMSTGLSGVLEQLEDLVCSEGIERHVATKAVLRIPSELRLCGMGVDAPMSAHFPTATLTLYDDYTGEEAATLIEESLPYLPVSADQALRSQQFADYSRFVRVSIGASTLFFAPISRCRVTLESARATVAALVWRLNSLRLCIIQRARKIGQGPLAALEDDAARLVCEFIASKPCGVSGGSEE